MCARMMKTVVAETSLDHDTSDYNLRFAFVKLCPCRSVELGVMVKTLLSILPMGKGFQLCDRYYRDERTLIAERLPHVEVLRVDADSASRMTS
jgi:hypothetical protein